MTKTTENQSAPASSVSSKDKESDTINPPKIGTFNIEIEDNDPPLQTDPPSTVGTFTLEDETSAGPIESITAETTKTQIDFIPSRTSKKTFSKLKLFLILLASYILILFSYNTYYFIMNVWDIHWSFGIFALLIIVSLALIPLISIISWFREPASLSDISVIQSNIEQLRTSRKMERVQPILNSLEKFYTGKPQELEFRKVRNELNDYHDESETIKFIEDHFYFQLDKQAMKRVHVCSLQVGISTALSPFPVLDMVLTFWRNVSMVSDILSIYGINPSIRNKYKILAGIFTNMATAGMTQDGFNSLASLISMNPLFGKAAEGLAMATASYTLGRYAIKVCRPIPLKQNEKSLLSDFKKAVYSKFIQQTSPDVEETKAP